MAPRTVWTFNFAGWILFLVSAVAFTWTTWAAGDPVGLPRLPDRVHLLHRTGVDSPAIQDGRVTRKPLR